MWFFDQERMSFPCGNLKPLPQVDMASLHQKLRAHGLHNNPEALDGEVFHSSMDKILYAISAGVISTARRPENVLYVLLQKGTCSFYIHSME